MNDLEFEAQKERVRRVYDRWDQPLGLKWWRITQEWCRDLSGFEGESNGHVNFTPLARTSASWEYMIATISFNLVGIADIDDEALERVVVHEMCHVLVREMRDDYGGHATHDTPAHEERVVSSLAQAFIWVRGDE